MNKKYKCAVAAVILFAFTATGWTFLSVRERQQWVTAPEAGKLIRLHILANSDSAADQQLKLKVRDAVVKWLSPRLAEAGAPEDARRIIADNQAQIIAVAQTVLAENGAGYSAALETGRFQFPLRTYGVVALPPGEYEAVRILLGKAAGKNWWCVLFPPLCFVDGTSAVADPGLAQPGPEGKAPAKCEIRWKLLEVWEETKNKLQS